MPSFEFVRPETCVFERQVSHAFRAERVHGSAALSQSRVLCIKRGMFRGPRARRPRDAAARLSVVWRSPVGCGGKRLQLGPHTLAAAAKMCSSPASQGGVCAQGSVRGTGDRTWAAPVHTRSVGMHSVGAHMLVVNHRTPCPDMRRTVAHRYRAVLGTTATHALARRTSARGSTASCSTTAQSGLALRSNVCTKRCRAVHNHLTSLHAWRRPPCSTRAVYRSCPHRNT